MTVDTQDWCEQALAELDAVRRAVSELSGQLGSIVLAARRVRDQFLLARAAVEQTRGNINAHRHHCPRCGHQAGD